MLLRRISKHVKDQNWFAVALDFFIVVAGILIAFQITNWSEERQERTLERHYLERLVEDMDKSIAETNFGLSFVTNNQKNAWVVHQSLSSCNIAMDEQDQFADGLYQVGRFLPVFYELGTINEMQSAGKFSAIRDPIIRTHLNNLAGEAKEYSELLQPISARLSLQLARMDRHLIINIEHFKPNSGSVTMDQVKIDLKSMCEDNHVLPALSAQRSINQYYIDRYNIALASLTKTRTAIRAELGLEEEEAAP